MQTQSRYQAWVAAIRAPAAVFVARRDNGAITLVAANGPFRQLQGLPPAATGSLPKAVEPELESAIHRAVDGAAGAEAIAAARRGDDSRRPWLRHTLTRVGEDGDAAAVLDLATEITPASAYRDDLLDAIWRTLPDALLVSDFVRSTLVCNSKFCEVWGLPMESVRRSGPEDILDHAARKMRDGDAFKREVRALRESSTICRHGWELALRDGRLFTIDTDPLTDAGGTYWGRIWYTRDVTRAKLTANALSESEQRFRQLADGSLQGIIVQRPDTRGEVVYMNAAARSMVEPAALDHWPPASKALPVDVGAVSEAAPAQINDLLSGARPGIRCTMPTRHATSGVEWVDVFATPAVWAGAPAIQLTLVDITEQKALERQLLWHATTDPLTGLGNRRRFMEEAERYFRSDRAEDHPLSLMLIDIDLFKQLNDTGGHPVGDDALRKLGEAMHRCLRDSDLACRIGGDEFAALMPGTNTRTARRVARRLQVAVRTADTGQPHPVTLSVGIAQDSPGDRRFEDLLARADGCLYAAKHQGRDRIEVAPDSPSDGEA
ncbi:diguanylate cyclase [Ectothiorhodospiraceae bacterium WFHF3C12]|nr:diguanylate cyclase [Ectothiorhodospiraceae bacterium WFHF3C12]